MKKSFMLDRPAIRYIVFHLGGKATIMPAGELQNVMAANRCVTLYSHLDNYFMRIEGVKSLFLTLHSFS